MTGLRSVQPRTVLVVATAALVALIVAEGLLPAAWLPIEEAAIAEEARGEPAAPGTAVAGLYPRLVGPLASNLDGESFLTIVRLLNALLWVGLAVPTFLLARARAPVLVAAAAAAATVILPAAVFASTVGPEALATLLVACAFALFAHPRTQGRRWALAASFACSVAAAGLRPWFAAVPPALVLAYALPRVRWRLLLRWPTSVALALLSGAVVIGVTGIAPELERASLEPWALLRSSIACAAVGAIGMAVLPWILAWAQIARARVDPLVAVLVTAGPSLAVAGGVAALAGGAPAVDERAIVALAPVVMVLAAGAWAGQAISERAFLVAAAATAATMALLPAPVEEPSLADAPGLALPWSVLTGLVGAGALFGLLTIGLAFWVVGAWRRPYVWAIVAAALVVGHMTAWREVERSASSYAAALPDAGWLDSHVDATGAVTVLDAKGDLTPPLQAQLALANRSLGPSVPVDPGAADGASGELPVGVPTPLVLARGIELTGSPVAQGELGTLVRIASPPRVAYAVDGVDTDGWAGERAHYRRHADSAPGRMRVTVSRRAWAGPDVPGAVKVRLSADSGAAAETDWTIHSKQHRVVEFVVPRGPFDIDVTVSPTFSPADFGSPDTRQLGAQVVFDYLPGDAP